MKRLFEEPGIKKSHGKVPLLKQIKFIVFDFDGVFTDNRVIVSEDGRESVICNRSDGLGLNLLKEIGIETAVISAETNPVVEARAAKLKINCYSGCRNKLETLLRIIKDKNISLADTAFVGNDINDLSCLKMVGLAVTVKDAPKIVKDMSKLILKAKGGKGAVREFCELVYKAQKIRKDIDERYIQLEG